MQGIYQIISCTLAQTHPTACITRPQLNPKPSPTNPSHNPKPDLLGDSRCRFSQRKVGRARPIIRPTSWKSFVAEPCCKQWSSERSGFLACRKACLVYLLFVCKMKSNTACSVIFASGGVFNETLRRRHSRAPRVRLPRGPLDPEGGGRGVSLRWPDCHPANKCEVQRTHSCNTQIR